MTPQATEKLKNMLSIHEGFRQFPYYDTTGNLTIGFGRNLSDRGISKSEALSLLDNDIDYFMKKLIKELPFFNELDEARKIVLVNMCFNLGVVGFLQFENMLDAVRRKDWVTAAKEIMSSKAARQAPKRYQQLANIMKTGVIVDAKGNSTGNIPGYRESGTLIS